MKIFGHRRLWYLTKFAKFRYRVGRGDALSDFFIGKIKTFLFGIMALGTSEIVIEAWAGISILKHIPWWIVLALPFIEMIKDYALGWLDEKKMNLMQIDAEIMLRRNLSPWESEKMERLKNIEKKIAPETYNENHKTYLEGEEEK